MKVLVIGAVGTTALTIEMLHNHSFDIVGVLGQEPTNKNRVSGLHDLQKLCLKLNLDYLGFQKINQDEYLSWAKIKCPDIIFAVGFSQLLSNDWLNLPTLGCIGFHPTVLPTGRGRAPVAWTILEGGKGAANFFLMSNGADNGPIFVQEVFELDNQDDAECFVPKLKDAIKKALDKWLPELKAGIWNPKSQNEADATYYGKREPCDSLINWGDHASIVDRLIKSSTVPHPGAFSFFKESLVTFWKCHVNYTHKYKGVVGRILLIEENRLLIQCGENSSIWIDKHETIENLTFKVGDKFGTLEQNKIDEHINKIIWTKNEK